MRYAGGYPLEPMEQVSTLEERRVERLAVETDERPRVPDRLANGVQHRLLVAHRRQHELAHDQGPGLEPRTADQKRMRAGAATQAGRFEIEKHEGRPRRRAAGEPRGLRRRASRAIGDRANRFRAVPGRRLEAAFDDK